MTGTTIEWTPSLETGIDAIDAEHRQLIDLLALIRAASQEQKRKFAATPLLAGLYRMFASHFAHEEKVMRELGYPRVRDHALQHKVMLGSFNQSLADHKTGRLEAVDDVVTLLGHWIVGHIGRDDRLLAEFIKRPRPDEAGQPRPEAGQPRPTPAAPEAAPAGRSGLLRESASRR